MRQDGDSVLRNSSSGTRGVTEGFWWTHLHIKSDTTSLQMLVVGRLKEAVENTGDKNLVCFFHRVSGVMVGWSWDHHSPPCKVEIILTLFLAPWEDTRMTWIKQGLRAAQKKMPVQALCPPHSRASTWEQGTLNSILPRGVERNQEVMESTRLSPMRRTWVSSLDYPCYLELCLVDRVLKNNCCWYLSPKCKWGNENTELIFLSLLSPPPQSTLCTWFPGSSSAPSNPTEDSI